MEFHSCTGLFLILTSVHYLISHQRFSFSFGGCFRPEGLLPYKCGLHSFHFDLDWITVNSFHNNVFQMAEIFAALKIDMQIILYLNLHLHRYILCLLGPFVREQYYKVHIFCHWKFVVFSHDHTDEVFHSSRKSVQCFVFLLEIQKLEII